VTDRLIHDYFVGWLVD